MKKIILVLFLNILLFFNFIAFNAYAEKQVFQMVFVPASEKGDNNDYIKPYENQIIEEINVKKVNYINNESELVKYKVKPNFSSINLKYKDCIPQILEFIKDANKDQIIKELRKRQMIDINQGEICLDANDFITEEIPIDNYVITSDNNFVVGVNTELNQKLIDEGITRDLIRKIQNLRKESGFKVEDRINISIVANDSIYKALEKNKGYFLNEVLGKELIFKHCNEKFNISFKINDEIIELGISIS